jgi:hypothetical protein
MLSRLAQLNAQMRTDLREPLRIGVGIHYSEAIVGAMAAMVRFPIPVRVPFGTLTKPAAIVSKTGLGVKPGS